MRALPDPLVPAHVSMAGNDWFKLHHHRLLRSRWWRTASDLARSRNVDLWAHAFDAVPAGSLPDDDVELADLAGFGRDVAAFAAVKAEIMGAWTLCSDGRWYHPTLCEVVLERWETTSTKRKADAERQRRHRERVTRKTPSVTRDDEGLSRMTEVNVTRETNTEEKEKDISPLPPTGGEVDRAFDLWNDTAAELGLPLARTLNDARRRKLRKRIGENGLDGWIEALDRVRRSRFLRGLSAPRKGGERPFQATLDFLLSPTNFTKVVEGNYGEDATPPRPTSPPPAAVSEDGRWRRALDGFKRDLWWPEDELGPRPGRPGCQVPSALLSEYGFTAEVIPLRQATA